MFGFVNKRCVVIVAIGTLGSVAQAQRAGTTGRDSVGDAAAALLNQGRPNEARMTLLQAMRSSTAPAQLATYRLELGDTFLFEGKYGQATQAYTAVLSGREAVTVDSLVRWAHHGLALVNVEGVGFDDVAICCDLDSHVFNPEHTDASIAEALRASHWFDLREWTARPPGSTAA